jgi:hypothetical protein
MGLPVPEVGLYGLFRGVLFALFDCLHDLDVVIHVWLPGHSSLVAFKRYMVSGFGDTTGDPRTDRR